ncbi:MAG: DNA-binding response regulator [Sheuella sp.]|nr:DNA-binding response regulator [Sheuella sp.]
MNSSAVRPIILLVDDTPSSLGHLYQSLENAGYSVVVALDGKSALERLELVLVDAVLLDAVMPGLSGFETCQRIKANPNLAHLPVIFMTGLAETENIVNAFDSGGVDYVVKPVRVEEVLARLQTHIRNARVARLAREAVDVAGFGVVLIDSQGRVAWQSPQARALLGEDEKDIDFLTLLSSTEVALSLPGHGDISIRNLGQVGLGETMLLLAQNNLRNGDTARLQAAALTQRESEVLSWVAKGKTNRDIAEILGMSPRTVNKHLEHIFDKLGVETRSAAAAIGARFSPD